MMMKALNMYKDFKGSFEIRGTKPFTTSTGWLCSFRNRIGLKNIKITGEAASADREGAATILVKLKLRRRDINQSKSSIAMKLGSLEENAQENLHS